MKAKVSPSNRPGIHTRWISLQELRPIINGVEYPSPPTIVTDRGYFNESGTADELSNWTSLIFIYALPELHGQQFQIGIQQDANPAQLTVSYGIENITDANVLDSFGMRCTLSGDIGSILCNGYHSWDGSYYVNPDEIVENAHGTIITGFAITQLVHPTTSECLVLGFDRHDRFQQSFTYQREDGTLNLTILTLWDRKHLPKGNCRSERLVLFECPEVEVGLRQWAKLVAATSPDTPRLPEERITGWCSWYNLYAAITEDNILEHLKGNAAVRDHEKLSLRVFQIDDGFTPEMGDWLEVKPQFPRGIKSLLDDIRSAEFIPGLWIAPFMVGNRSRLYQEHPDWVVKERGTGNPFVQMRFYGEFRWHKRSEEYYILDVTHPEAFEYIRQVFRIWRHEWGCEYFKTDFMLFGSEYGPEQVAWHTPGMTRIEVWRRMAEMIREEIGDALWLGCGCPLWASVGLVDAVRIGRDIGVQWSSSEQSAQSLLQDLMTRNFANGILWQSDPDCVLLRDRFHYLSDDEVQSLALYAGLSGGVLTTSDTLEELSRTRLDLLKLLLSPEWSGCRFPLLGQEQREGVAVQVREGRGSKIDLYSILLVNMDKECTQYKSSLDALGISDSVYLYDWFGERNWVGPTGTISAELSRHGSILFFATASLPKAQNLQES